LRAQFVLKLDVKGNIIKVIGRLKNALINCLRFEKTYDTIHLFSMWFYKFTYKFFFINKQKGIGLSFNYFRSSHLQSPLAFLWVFAPWTNKLPTISQRNWATKAAKANENRGRSEGGTGRRGEIEVRPGLKSSLHM